MFHCESGDSPGPVLAKSHLRILFRVSLKGMALQNFNQYGSISKLSYARTLL